MNANQQCSPPLPDPILTTNVREEALSFAKMAQVWTSAHAKWNPQNHGTHVLDLELFLDKVQGVHLLPAAHQGNDE